MEIRIFHCKSVCRKILSRQGGFTLVELIVYLAVLTIVLGIVIAFLFWAMRSNAKIKALSETQDNARRAMEIMMFEIRQAASVYTPTSLLNSSSSPGQLSLETKLDPPSGEAKTYKDFFVYGGRLFLKKEGNQPEQLTSDRVRVANLVFKYFNSTSTLANVGINITIDYNNPAAKPELQAETALISSATLRAY